MSEMTLGVKLLNLFFLIHSVQYYFWVVHYLHMKSIYIYMNVI